MSTRMQTAFKKAAVVMFIIIVVLVVDQGLKIWIKTNMFLHESLTITNWFYLSFIENNGAAFGMEIVGKLFLTLFRIVAVCLVGYYLLKQIKSDGRWKWIICLSLVLAGAAGNIFDCLFYGMIFDESTATHISQFVPFGHGYSSLFMGKVVDMLYFPIISIDWPGWIPFIGGNHFVFFSPVFNFADSAITCGIIAMLIYCRKELSNLTFKKSKKADEPAS